MNRSRRVAVSACLFAASALLGAGCGKTDEATAVDSGPVSVATATARVDTLVDRVTGSGTVVPSQAADWVVYAPEPAEIVELPKQEGDAVKTGDLLVRYDVASITDALSAAELAVAAAKARVDAAKAEMAKLAPLDARGMVARKDVDAARDVLIAAQASETQATAQRDSAKSRQAVTEVHARFNGTVAKSYHVRGDTVAASTSDPVLRVVDSTRLQVLATLPVSDVNRIEPGQTAIVAPPGGEPEPATVVMRPTITDKTVMSGEVRLAFTGPSALALDTLVDLQILIDQREGALIIPRSALLKDDAGATYVLVAGDDSIAHRRAVELGFTTRERVQVTTGLTAGERVITSGLDQIADGSQILIER